MFGNITSWEGEIGAKLSYIFDKTDKKFVFICKEYIYNSAFFIFF